MNEILVPEYPFHSDPVIPVIDCIEAITVSLPFVTPFSTSSYTWNSKDALLIKLSAGEISGWGECVADPDPFYSPETTASSLYIIRNFILPLLTPGKLLSQFLADVKKIRGNYMAKAAVENALLDLITRMLRIPLCNFLGYKPKRIMSGISIGIQENTTELLSKVSEAVDAGYHRIKIKIKRGNDIDMVDAVRNRFPLIQLMVDANGDYTLKDTGHLKKLDEYQLLMIEQPLSYSDIYLHSLLQRELDTPLCLDESIHSLEDTITALELGSCRIINIKEGRVGGLAESLRIVNYCRSKGIPVWSGGMDETGIGRAFNLHLQTVSGFTLPGDTSETKRYFAEDIVYPPVILDADGFIKIPEGPGTGVTVLQDSVDKFTLAREVLA